MTARLKPTVPAGAILAQHVDEDFTAWVKGETVEQRTLIGVFQAASVSGGNKDAGRVTSTAYEAVHLVEVTDAHEADRVRHLITQIRADRGLAARQPALFDTSEDEQRETVLGYIRDWASENDLPMADVDERWLSTFGGPEYAASATVQSGSLQQLKEFALTVGAITDEPVKTESTAPDVLFQDAGDDPDAEDDV